MPFLQLFFRLRYSLVVACLLLSGCINLIKPHHEFADEDDIPASALDYSQPDSWAALPTRADAADQVPEGSTLQDRQAQAAADVFFVHPTTLFRREWNADPRKDRLNSFTDRASIRKQASVFNAAARIYAPRYRQATLMSFFDSTANGQQALELAYQDVRSAFQYYLKHYNQKRPIIVAGHSQGTQHAKRLLREFFDRDPALRRRLVAAYLIGFNVPATSFQALKPCADSLQTGCYVTWNAAEWGHGFAPWQHSVVVNPLTWTMDTTTAPATLNRGSVPNDFESIEPQKADAKIHNGVLWVHPPEGNGYPRFLLPGQPALHHSFHIVDYGLFYMNLRRNALARVQAWQRRN
ncbi:DUF3089 domain-containing protein [Hymenobacter busanensis]|uniref:DUF3089 domain-containing protein n=1 Tax=Hymenobacter busanensis TaxID=2607656 RepID=A0A7L5A0D6_9BACT|nr:DUF3089 domain-containing protein [Hymenobacter busanensis]KAA9338583.1 DUF3089 domain-containing protein [Hymenobacter busanensis]QHJ08988.1 DUF3089 domain-containing protein [Hymenobacter busanensis]